MLPNKLKKNEKRRSDQDLMYQLAGWILFIICAVFFCAASLKNGDTLTFVGSVIFLVACIVFLIPLVRSAAGTEKVSADEGRDDFYSQGSTD